MDTLTTLAITKALSASSKTVKNARSAVSTGEHAVCATVKLEGVLKVQEDQEITPTASLLNLEFLALVLHCAGVTRESAVRAIEAVSSEYLVDWTGSKEDKKAAKAARKARVEEFDPEGKLSAIFDTFKNSLPKIPRAGKVTFKGDVEEIAMPTNLHVVEEADVA